MKVKNLEELHDKVHEVYECILSSSLGVASEMPGGIAQTCEMAYELAFASVIHEDDFFMKAVQENIDDLIIVEPKDREKVKPAYADTLLMKEVVMNSRQPVTIYGNKGPLASVVLDYIQDAGITMSDPAYHTLLNSLATGSKTEETKRLSEYVLAHYYRTCPPSSLLLRHNKSEKDFVRKIEHLLLDVSLEHLNRQKEAITQQLKSGDKTSDLNGLLRKFNKIQEERRNLCIALGRD